MEILKREREKNQKKKPGPGAAKSHVKGSSNKHVGGGLVPASRRAGFARVETHTRGVHTFACVVYLQKRSSRGHFNYATAQTPRVHCESFADPDALLRGSSSRGSWSEPADRLSGRQRFPPAAGRCDRVTRRGAGIKKNKKNTRSDDKVERGRLRFRRHSLTDGRQRRGGSGRKVMARENVSVNTDRFEVIVCVV